MLRHLALEKKDERSYNPRMSENEAARLQGEQAGEADAGSTSWGLFAVALAVIVGVYLAVMMFRGGEPGGTSHPAVGTPLPSFAAPALDPATGEIVSLASLKGKVALIDYWGPWCPPCRLELPHLIRLAAARKSKPFELVLVTCGARANEDLVELAAESRAMVDQIGREVPLYADPLLTNRKTLVEAAKLDGFGYPTTVLLDKEGVIRGLWEGYRDEQEEEMAEAVDRLLES
jgi:thiol-disulfide isomerase/thioredoxin